MHRAARQRFESQRARSGEEIEDTRARQERLHDTHPGFADAVGRGSHVAPRRRGDAPSLSTAPQQCAPIVPPSPLCHARKSVIRACSRFAPCHSSRSIRKTTSTGRPTASSRARSAIPHPSASSPGGFVPSPPPPASHPRAALAGRRERSCAAGPRSRRPAPERRGPDSRRQRARNGVASIRSPPSRRQCRSRDRRGLRGAKSSAVNCARATALKRSAKASICPRATVTPAATRCPPNRINTSRHAARPAYRSNAGIDRPDPRPCSPASATRTVGRPYSSTMRDATIPMTPGCQR